MIFDQAIKWIKGVWNMLTKSTIKTKIGTDVAVSSAMSEALETWSNMYKNQAEWLNDDIKSLNLPAAISGELANLVTIEMSATFIGDKRAEYLKAQMDRVIPKLRQMIEYGNAKGGLMLKPFPNGKEIDVDYVQADQFMPVSFDANGNITSCVFVDQRTQGKDFYTRLEWHAFDSKTQTVTIKNLAFKSSVNSVDIGRPVPLTEFEPWAGLQPEAKITNVKAPLYGYYRFPLANNIDPTSPLGVSCFSRAVDLIKQADIQWSNLLWEFESGKRAIFADVLAFDRDEDGKPKLPDKRLYRALANSTNNIGEDGFFHVFSPEFREASILSGLDAILKKIEYNCGLAYGTISDPQVESKTATEIKISKQRTYATVKGMQNALTNALNQLLYAMDVWASLNKLAAPGKYTAVYDYDDSVIVDKDAQFTQDLRVVGQGIMSKVEFRVRNYGEDEETAKKKIAEAQGEQPEEKMFGSKSNG